MEIQLLNRMNPDQLEIYRKAKLSKIDLENVIFNETNVLICKLANKTITENEKIKLYNHLTK